MKRFLLLVMITIISMAIKADGINYDRLRISITSRLCQLNDYISFMTDNYNDFETECYYKKQVLNIFVGRGYDYEEDGVYKDGVRLQINSKNMSKTRTMLVRVYLNGLVNNTNKDVLIEYPQPANIKVGDIQIIDDDNFVCCCYYDQAFVGQTNVTSICRDITRKKIKCYVERQETEDGFEYSVLFGDLYAVETK